MPVFHVAVKEINDEHVAYNITCKTNTMYEAEQQVLDYLVENAWFPPSYSAQQKRNSLVVVSVTQSITDEGRESNFYYEL